MFYFIRCCLDILFIHSFIQVVCLTTGPKPLPKRALHIVRSRASSFKWEYPLLSLRSSSSFLRLLPRLPVTSIPPFIFPSITRCRRQFLRKTWPIRFAFCLRKSCRIFLCSLTLSNTSHTISPTDLFHPSPAPHFKNFQLFLIWIFYIILNLFMFKKIPFLHSLYLCLSFNCNSTYSLHI